MCETTPGWTDATASRQLTTILIDADARQVVDPGIALETVCIRTVVVATASGTGMLGVLLPACIIVS